jgi:hypothetical protein
MIVLFDQQPSLRRELQRLRVPTEFDGLELIQMIRQPGANTSPHPWPDDSAARARKT